LAASHHDRHSRLTCADHLSRVNESIPSTPCYSGHARIIGNPHRRCAIHASRLSLGGTMPKVARIVLENDRAITSLRYSIATDISADTKWSFVTLDSILKYC